MKSSPSGEEGCSLRRHHPHPTPGVWGLHPQLCLVSSRQRPPDMSLLPGGEGAGTRQFKVGNQCVAVSESSSHHASSVSPPRPQEPAPPIPEASRDSEKCELGLFSALPAAVLGSYILGSTFMPAPVFLALFLVFSHPRQKSHCFHLTEGQGGRS